MNMEGWVLLGADRQEVPVTMYPGQDLVEADLSDVPDVYQDLHWHAPRTYLGDKVRHLLEVVGQREWTLAFTWDLLQHLSIVTVDMLWTDVNTECEECW